MEHANEPHRTRPVAIGLIVLGVVSRVVPHPWNATPVTAIALFGGAYLSKRASIVMPLAIVAMSDFLLGWHHTTPFTWGAFVLTAMLGWWVRRRASTGRIAGASLFGSIMFFLITNFGVWLPGDLYPRTMAGLWACYVAAVPFFRATLVGDLVFTAVFFGSFALATRLGSAPVREPS